MVHEISFMSFQTFSHPLSRVVLLLDLAFRKVARFWHIRIKFSSNLLNTILWRVGGYIAVTICIVGIVGLVTYGFYALRVAKQHGQKWVSLDWDPFCHLTGFSIGKKNLALKGLHEDLKWEGILERIRFWCVTNCSRCDLVLFIVSDRWTILANCGFLAFW